MHCYIHCTFSEAAKHFTYFLLRRFRGICFSFLPITISLFEPFLCLSERRFETGCQLRSGAVSAFECSHTIINQECGSPGCLHHPHQLHCFIHSLLCLITILPQIRFCTCGGFCMGLLLIQEGCSELWESER